ncbi:MAG: LamG-like jellyroll fold domain-containing protein [Bacteroidota bacterium]
MSEKIRNIIILISVIIGLTQLELKASDFTENTFLIAEINAQNYNSNRLWNFVGDNKWSGIKLELDTLEHEIVLANTNTPLNIFLEKINTIVTADDSKLIPVFLNYSGDVLLLDSVINNSEISSRTFYLPQGEAWPALDYLIQAKRQVLFFISGNFVNESRVLHAIENYAFQISATQLAAYSTTLENTSNINKELLIIENFDQLPTEVPPNRLSRNLNPDYINNLLENWKKFGKKPNFLLVGNNNVFNFDFIIDQLNSFQAIKGQVRISGKNLERVYWKNPDILVTGGEFSIPYRGGEEVILSPFAPGYQMTPYQIIVTSEMVVPENFRILANPLELAEGLQGSFRFDDVIRDELNPEKIFDGTGYSFTEDIERGSVLRLPENANINLGNPDNYGLPNSSFTVSCFVKFTDIMEFGDNAIMGNAESGYRRGMHLVLRSGHPYFGLWANDFMSDEILENNTWYHLAWRYILETGEQAIFLNGQYIGSSDGHPPYSGTSDIHVGSAISQGASLRGYIDDLYIWDRPLGNDEINRLALDEEIEMLKETEKGDWFSKNFLTIIFVISGLIILIIIGLVRFRKGSKKNTLAANAPVTPNKNQVQLFGEFRAINSEGKDITELFTPKVKELLLFTLIYTLKNGIGASVTEVNDILWEGIKGKKAANNRAVTLNKLRKILTQFNAIEIVSNSGYLQFKSSGIFFSDYLEAFRLCQIPEGMTTRQLETFFHLVKKGRLLKGIDWPWLDEIRGFTGNQVIDNLIKLASVYKKQNRPKEVEALALRILDYDDLNEEAIFLQIWALQASGNTHLAKFNFKSFCSKYEKSMSEPYSMDFNQFTAFYAEQL